MQPQLENLVQQAALTNDPCSFFKALYELRLKDASRWSMAAFLVGLTAALAIISAIILATLGETVTAIASGIGTIVTGAATAWLWSRRTDVQNEVATLLASVHKYCGENGE